MWDDDQMCLKPWETSIYFGKSNKTKWVNWVIIFCVYNVVSVLLPACLLVCRVCILCVLYLRSQNTFIHIDEKNKNENVCILIAIKVRFTLFLCICLREKIILICVWLKQMSITLNSLIISNISWWACMSPIYMYLCLVCVYPTFQWQVSRKTASCTTSITFANKKYIYTNRMRMFEYFECWMCVSFHPEIKFHREISDSLVISCTKWIT